MSAVEQLLSDQVISEEVAQNEFQNVLDFYDIDFDDIKEERVKNGMESSMRKIIRAIRKGNLTIKENPEGVPIIIQTLRRRQDKMPETIEYGEPGGKAKIAMSKAADNDHYGKLYALLGSISGLGHAKITMLKGVDMSLAECIGTIFLQV